MQIGNRCILPYNIHPIMKTIWFPAHRSNGFVATHALGHINLSQRAFLESKAALSFDRLLFLCRRKEFCEFYPPIFCVFSGCLQTPCRKYLWS